MERKLINYLPAYLGKYKEIQTLMAAEQTMFEQFSDAVDDVLADQFIEDATETGIQRRENHYKITPKANQSLEERRFILLAKENESLPFTEEKLRLVLENLCGEKGFSLVVFNDAYEVLVKLDLSNEKNLDTVRGFMDEILPANMVRNVRLYNNYALLNLYTHEYLSAYTYEELRKEVL